MEFVSQGRERLDRFLVRLMPQHSRTKIAKFIESEGVEVDGQRTHKAGFDLKPGVRVVISDIPEEKPHDLTPVPMDLDVRFEDDHLLVVNKPRGLTVHPASTTTGPTLVHGLLAHTTSLSGVDAGFRPGIVHRLDKDTTGLMIVAKTDQAHAVLAAQIKARTVGRRYVAFVHGAPEHPQWTIDAPIGRNLAVPGRMTVRPNARNAVTHVRILKQMTEGCLVACRLETGRTHQIRVHLAWQGHPVWADPFYGVTTDDGPMALHAAGLQFAHPASGEDVTVYAPPPADFRHAESVTEEGVTGWK